jgi:CRP-like cAMP-binding protein
VRHLDDGGTVTLHVARAGESFAEAALFSPVYHCDAIADEPSQVTIHAKDALLRTLGSDPDAATDFMARLARQVMGLRSRLELRNIRSARKRVMQYLRLSRREGTDSVTFEQSLKDVAGEIGLSHEAFYRTLAGLEKDGRIERHGRTLRILSRV